MLAHLIADTLITPDSPAIWDELRGLQCDSVVVAGEDSTKDGMQDLSHERYRKMAAHMSNAQFAVCDCSLMMMLACTSRCMHEFHVLS